MKAITILKRSTAMLLLFSFAATLISFSKPMGGIHFTIHLNKQLAAERHYGMKDGIKTLELSDLQPSDELIIKSSHCGQFGKKSVISLVSTDNQTLQQWQFDEGASKDGIALKIQSLKTFKQKGLKLVYTSQEVPGGFELIAFS